MQDHGSLIKPGHDACGRGVNATTNTAQKYEDPQHPYPLPTRQRRRVCTDFCEATCHCFVRLPPSGTIAAALPEVWGCGPEGPEAPQTRRHWQRAREQIVGFEVGTRTANTTLLVGPDKTVHQIRRRQCVRPDIIFSNVGMGSRCKYRPWRLPCPVPTSPAVVGSRRVTMWAAAKN